MTDYYDQLDSYQAGVQDWSGTSGSANQARHPGRSLDAMFEKLKQPIGSPDYRSARVAAEAPINPLYRPVGGAAQGSFQPAGPPQRYSANLLGDVVAGAAGSAPGQFFLGQPGQQRGGIMDVDSGFGHFGLATAPVTFANFATYAREGALSAITSALGHHYQQGENGAAPAGPDNNRDILGNLGAGDLPGVLDNVIDGLTTAGDVVNAPFVAFGDFMRDNAAHSRGEAVRDLVRSGGTFGDPISRISSLFDQSRFGWDSIVRKAQERGISTTAMAAELWDLDPAIVEAIQQKPDMKDDELYKLVAGQPFSYNPGVNILAELAVLGAPMLAGGWAIQSARGALAGTKLLRLLKSGETLENLGLFGRPVAAAERIGSWSLPKAWRTSLRVAGAVTGVTPTGFKIGAGIRFGEWAFKQIASVAGNDEAVRAADEWLWEMPLSNNPGLMMVDAFRVHPLHEAKAVKGRVTAIGRKLFGSDEAVPSSPVFAKALASVAAMDLPTLQTRLLDKLGWDESWAGRFFGEDGPQSLNDLKNGLLHVALQVVREDHELRAKYLAPGEGIIARARAFEEAYGDEGAQLLRHELEGHGTRIVDALKTEFWDRANLIDASDLGQEPAIGPYDPSIAFTKFASWVRVSKLFSGIAEDAVPKLTSEVNREFIAAYRKRLLESYPDAKSLVSARDLNLLQTYVPMTAKLEGSPTRGRRAVGKVNRATVERLLDQAEHVQGGTDLVRAQPRTEAMPALAPLEADNLAAIGKAFKLRADTIDAIQRGLTDGPEGLGAVPADLSAVLTKVYGSTEAQIKRMPELSWQQAFEWYTRMYDSAVRRGAAIDTVGRFEKIIEDRFAATADAGLDHEAFNRLRSALTHPYAEAELNQTPALRPIAAERDAALAEFIDGMGGWLDSPLRRLHVRQMGDLVVLETDNFKATDVAVIDYLAERAKATDLRPEQLALLDDPAAHPLEKVPPIKAALDNGMDAAKPAIERLNELGTLESEFRPLFEQAYGPEHDPVTRETVMKLTDEVASHADELDSLRQQVRSLGGLIDRSPASTIADDTREFYDRAATLGATRPGTDVTRPISKAGKKAPKPAAPNWRALQLEPQGIKVASNERQLGHIRATLDRTIAERQAVLDTYEEAVKRYTTRAADKLTVDDYTWSDPVFSERTLSAARDQAKGLMEGGIPALVEKVGPKRWVVRRGELRAERAIPTAPEGIAAPEAAVPKYPQPAVEPPSAPQPVKEVNVSGPPIADAEAAVAAARAEVVRMEAAGETFGIAMVGRDEHRAVGEIRGREWDASTPPADVLTETNRAWQALEARRATDTGPLHGSTENPTTHVARFDAWGQYEAESAIERVALDRAHRALIQSGVRPPILASPHRLGAYLVSVKWEGDRAVKIDPQGVSIDNDYSQGKLIPVTPEILAWVREHDAAQEAAHRTPKAVVKAAEKWLASPEVAKLAAARFDPATAPPPGPPVRGNLPSFAEGEAAPVTPPAPIVERIRADEKVRAALEERWLADEATKSQAYTAHGEAYRAARVEPAEAGPWTVRDGRQSFKTKREATEAAARGLEGAQPDRLGPMLGARAAKGADGRWYVEEQRSAGATTTVPFLDPLDNKTPVQTRVVLVDANDLLTSDQIGFPANLQPRSRSARASSDEQVMSYARDIQPDKLLGVTEGAQGMPVVNPDGAVVAGNGRTMALRIADGEQFGRYKVRIQAEAGKYGIPIEAVNAMERPMLVRELVDVDPVTTQRLAWQLNEMPLGDLAPSLAAAITREDIRALQVGDEQTLEAALKSGTNDAAIGRMLGRLPADARARYRGPGGAINEQGVRLLEGSLLAKLLRADDRTLPTFDAARNVVFDVVEQGGEEMRRITNALAESAGQILKVQEQAETGLLGKEILEFSDDLTPALGRILELRQTGYNMDGVANALDNVTAFEELTLTPVQTQLAKVLASSASQREVREFLRGVAEAGGKLGAEGMELFAEQRTDYTGLLNAGLRAWNDIRRERGLPQLDPFPSTEPPYDIPLTGARKSVTGADLPPVIQSQPLAAEELPGEIAARTAGEPVHGIVEQVETTPPGARTVSSTDPNEQAYIEAVTTDAQAVRAEINDVLDTLDGFKGTGPRRDFYNALLDSANDGTIGPGEWAVLKGLAGGLIRRNKAGKLNMAPIRKVPDRDGLLAAADADARQLAGKGTVPFDDAASVVSPHVQHPISPEELAADVGPDVPHAPEVPLADEIAGRTDHIVVSNENPTLNAALRRKVGAPDVRDAKRRVIELNAPEATKAIENLARLRAQALAGVEQARHARADFDVNPPIPPEVEQPSVFATPELGGMWDKLMRSGHDQLAAAIGSQEPRSLGEILDAVESIDKGFITDPSTGVGLTMNEAAELKSELMTLANAQLGVALERSGVRRQSAALRSLGKPPPDDFDLEGMQERARAIVDEVGQMITVDDPALPPMAGFMGVQYVPSRPPTRSRVAPGEPLTPRILFRDRFADDIIPTLNEELATGRMEDFPRRVENARVVRFLDHLAGPRVEKDLRARAIQNFTAEIERFVDPELVHPDEFTRIGKVVDAAFKAWRETVETTKLAGYPLFRRVHLMGPEKFNKLFAEAVEEVYGTEHPGWLDAMVGQGKTPHQLWRRADNRLRNYLAESSGIGAGLERLYGAIADKGAGPGGGLTVLYHAIRFLGDIRWLGLEAVEPSLLALFKGGLRPVVEAGPLRKVAGQGKEPIAFGQKMQAQTFGEYAHWAQLSDVALGPSVRHRYLVRELAQEQKRPFRDAMIEMAERDPHLGELVRQMGDTPTQFVERLDRDFNLADQRGRTFATRAEAERFFRPWLDGGFIDERTFGEYVDARRYSPHPAIEEELAKVVGDKTAEALYTRLAQINHDLFHNLTETFFGQADRSNVQRLLNHPLLYWPISYQIKATKWLLNVMLDHAFGVDTGAAGGYAFQRVADEHKRRMLTDPRYAANVQANTTLYFIASMLLPITPWDIGVSLSPWTRMAIDPTYQRQFGVFGVGPFYTYGSLLPRLIAEQTKPGGLLAGTPLGERLAQAAPQSITITKRPTSTIDAENQRVAPANPIPVPPYEPTVPRLP